MQMDTDLLMCVCFIDTAPTEIYTLSLHDALPIFIIGREFTILGLRAAVASGGRHLETSRSEEHTSELPSHLNLVCRLLLDNRNGASSVPPHSTSRLSRASLCADGRVA